MKKVKKFVGIGFIWVVVTITVLCIWGYMLEAPIRNEIKENGYTRENLISDTETYNECVEIVNKMNDIVRTDESGLDDVWVGGDSYVTSYDQFKLRVETLNNYRDALNNKEFKTNLYDGLKEEFNAIADAEIKLYLVQAFDNDGYEIEEGVEKYRDKVQTLTDNVTKHADEISEHEEELDKYLK